MAARHFGADEVIIFLLWIIIQAMELKATKKTCPEMRAKKCSKISQFLLIGRWLPNTKKKKRGNWSLNPVVVNGIDSDCPQKIFEEDIETQYMEA